MKNIATIDAGLRRIQCAGKLTPFIERFQRFILRLFPTMNLPGVVRVSIGFYNTRSDIDMLAKTLEEMPRQLKSENKTAKASFENQMKDYNQSVINSVYGEA